MQETTLCYLEHQGSYLMLQRNKKQNDPNLNKWIGVGGHLLDNESPDECLVREVKEETGLILDDYKLRAIVTFTSNIFECEQMYLYTADKFHGALIECDEGSLKWIKKDEITNLNLWQGDRVFLDLIRQDSKFFTLKLVYENDNLVQQILKFH